MSSAGCASVLVVGGGLAGFHVAHALRRSGFDGSVTVLGDELHAPYDRPPLSKGYLLGLVQVEDLGLDNATDPQTASWVRGVVADQLSVVTRTDGADCPTVITTDGRQWTADAVVLATGAAPIRIGAAVPGSHVLRTIEDAERLRSEGLTDRRVIVVGTGFIGLEAAAVATTLGAADVCVLAPEQVPLADRYGPEVGAAVQALHEHHGVRFRTGSLVAAITTDPSGHANGVELTDGERMGADVVIIGIGVRPATGWLAGSALADRLAADGAILCDDRGAAGMPGVWALGDCARWRHGDSGGLRRAGHWQDALDQAAVVAAQILGREGPAMPEPYCWSDQYDVRLQIAGHLHGDEVPVVKAGGIDTADLLVSYERAGVETAVLGMNRPRDVMRWRRTRPSRPHADALGTG